MKGRRPQPRHHPPKHLQEEDLQAGRGLRLLQAEQLHMEDERGVGGDDGRHALGAVGEVGGDGELGHLAQGHPGHALLPPRDHLGWGEAGIGELQFMGAKPSQNKPR